MAQIIDIAPKIQYSLIRKIKVKIISNIINPKSIYFFIFFPPYISILTYIYIKVKLVAVFRSADRKNLARQLPHQVFITHNYFYSNIISFPILTLKWASGKNSRRPFYN